MFTSAIPIPDATLNNKHHTARMSNNADPDQSASKKPTDLDLHCLQKSSNPESL